MVGRLLPSDAETDAPATATTARARRKLTIAVTALCRRGTVRCRTCVEIMFPPPNDQGIIGCADALVEYSSHPGAAHHTIARFLIPVGRASLSTGVPRRVHSPGGSEQ